MTREGLKTAILKHGLNTTQLTAILSAAEQFAESAFLAGKHGEFSDYEDYTSARNREFDNITNTKMRVYESKIGNYGNR